MVLFGWTTIEAAQAAGGGALRALREGAVVAPLRRLYADGPAAVGCWEGMAQAEVCAQLTGSPADFWGSSEHASLECAARIERHFGSWLVLADTALYAALAWCAWRALWGRLGRLGGGVRLGGLGGELGGELGDGTVLLVCDARPPKRRRLG